MADSLRQSALAGHIHAGPHGAAGERLALREVRPSAIAQVNGAPDESALANLLEAQSFEPSPRANQAARGTDITLLWNGPGRWLAVSATLSPETLIATLEEALGDAGATVTDLSHARTVVQLDGEASRELLTKLCPLDIERLQPGASATSLLGQLTGHLHCVDEQVFELYVFRSFGLELWEMLLEEGLEFGVRVSV